MAEEWQYYDPNYYDQNYYDPNWEYQEEPQEDTESTKLRKEQAEKERREAILSNRLFLKKVRKQCVKEDFSDLEKLQLFLFEVLIDSLEVVSDSSLGLLADEDVNFVATRVRFLNSPYMEICENNEQTDESRRGTFAETDYFEKINEAGNQDVYSAGPRSNSGNASRESARDGESSHRSGQSSLEEEVEPNMKWENASGKSCLFSMTPLMIIQDLDQYPVVLQVVRCGLTEDDSEVCEPIGYAQFRLPEDFSLSVLQSCKSGVVLPVSSVHREICDIKNVFGVKKGTVEVFVRLSSFGPVIITNFQATGPDRKYLFSPSPMSSNFKEDDGAIKTREQLKPLIAEEENTIGITVLKKFDEFQKSVVWKKKNDCDFGFRFSSNSDRRVSSFSSLGSLRLPISSDLSLCRDTQPAGDFRKGKMPRVCDWHNLVGSAVENSPADNCGCMPSNPPNEPSKPISIYKSEPCSKNRGNANQSSKPVEDDTKMKKMVKPLNPESQPKGFGLMPEPTDCNCNCPEIRDYLNTMQRLRQ